MDKGTLICHRSETLSVMAVFRVGSTLNDLVQRFWAQLPPSLTPNGVGQKPLTAYEYERKKKERKKKKKIESIQIRCLERKQGSYKKNRRALKEWRLGGDFAILPEENLLTKHFKMRFPGIIDYGQYGSFSAP